MKIKAIKDLPLKGIKQGDEYETTGAYMDVYFIRLKTGGMVSVSRYDFEQVSESDKSSK